MNGASLFSGVGGPDLEVGGLFDGAGLLAFGLHLAGLRHAWLCEVDPWRREILAKRFPGVPVFDDVRVVGAASARPVDVVAGGFPCKGASTAGKREGFGHPETVLWREMRRAIGELRPRYVLIENVANLLALHGGAVWGEVLGDLAALGFDVVWDCLPAAAVGAPHRRDRVFAVATHADLAGREQRGGGESAAPEHATAERAGAATADPSSQRRQQVAGGSPSDEAAPVGGGRVQQDSNHVTPSACESGLPADRGVAVDWGQYGPAIRRWEGVHGPAPEPLVRRVDDGGTRRVERSRLSALGDGVQVQVGLIAGQYIVDRERERVAA